MAFALITLLGKVAADLCVLWFNKAADIISLYQLYNDIMMCKDLRSTIRLHVLQANAMISSTN